MTSLNITREREQIPVSSSSRCGLLDSEAQIRRNRILSKDWEKAVERVRTINGFSNFLRAVLFATPQAAAAEGPVILSNYHADAIIHHINNPPLLVPLPGVRPNHLNHLTEQLGMHWALNDSSSCVERTPS